MGYDFDIVNIKTSEYIGSIYITSNFTKYQYKYPGANAINGHRNYTVIKILKKTLKKMLDDNITPCVYKQGGKPIAFGDPDPVKDLQCYAACLCEFLNRAISIQNDYKNSENIYWYSNQVWGIKKFSEVEDNEFGDENKNDDGYESDGVAKD